MKIKIEKLKKIRIFLETAMAIFHFPQFEHELFWRQFKRLNIFLAQCSYHAGK